jgi:hypothetical protein
MLVWAGANAQLLPWIGFYSDEHQRATKWQDDDVSNPIHNQQTDVYFT